MRKFFYYPPLYFDCFWAGPQALDDLHVDGIISHLDSL